MNLNSYIKERMNKIASEQVSRGNFPDTAKLLQFFNKHSINPRDWVYVDSDYKSAYQKLIVGTILIDAFEDIAIWQSNFFNFRIVEVKSERKIYVPKSVIGYI